jgi:hypothetical protein
MHFLQKEKHFFSGPGLRSAFNTHAKLWCQYTADKYALHYSIGLKSALYPDIDLLNNFAYKRVLIWLKEKFLKTLIVVWL